MPGIPSQLVMFAWVFITIVFLFNFHLASGYLALVNLVFIVSSILLIEQ